MCINICMYGVCACLYVCVRAYILYIIYIYIYYIIYYIIYSQVHTYTHVYIYYIQFGNTCYFNSVLQALYSCKIFRDAVLSHAPETATDDLLKCLRDLFMLISSKKKKAGVIAPKKFYAQLRHDNGI